MRVTTHRISPVLRGFTTALMLLGVEANLFANPAGMTVQSGSAAAAVSGSKLTVTTSQNAFLNWQSFNINAGETTVFNQPSASSIVFNQINGQSASQIFGSLQANGTVVLMNSSGFYFGPNSFVSAAGLVVSTANCAPPPAGGGTWEFNGPPPQASIINYGQISVGKGGSAYLIAENVQNNGTINAPEGSIGLVSGQNMVLSERPDGRGLSVKVNVPAGTVDNEGFLRANGGNISLEAQAVNQGGVIQANSVKDEGGVIELVAADNLTLGANSQISANGDASAGGSAGGSITLQSGNTFSDRAGSQVSATGGSQGGNGGSIEISAPSMSSLNSKLNAGAQAGYTAGKLSLDPDYIILDTSGPDGAGSGTVLAGDNPGDTLDLNVNSAFSGFSQISLQANYDITLADGTFWSLSDSTGQSGGTLTLQAGRNIIFGNTTGLYDANSWSVALYAGVGTFSLSQPTVTPGAGSIYLNAYDPNNPNNTPYDPSGYIQTAAGSITLVAGQDIIVGAGVPGITPNGNPANTGSITTTGGGSISVHALAGNIDTGGTAQGYNLSNSGRGNYDVSDGLGGISTAAGGDVSLVAGGNVESLLPGNGNYDYDGASVSISAPNSTAVNGNDYITAGSGAYGNQSGQAGNVTIVAGGNVTGHYLVANGVGSIHAGVKMDASGNPVTDAKGNYVLGGSGSAGTDLGNPDLSLSLILGGWNVTAANNIVLQEVNNPSGDFDTTGGTADHYFDYGAADYVNLNAGNEVQLGTSAGSLARLTSADNIQVPIIYPPTLNVAAGAGGVVLKGDGSVNNDQLILFPSPQGSLTIDTSAGGSLMDKVPNSPGGNPQLFSLIVSDSGRSQFNSSSGSFFGLNDHAATPVHYGSETPIDLNIAGDVDDLLLGFPEAAQINVGGNMNNCGYQGMNLAANDLTSINVAGNINNRSIFTSVVLNPADGEAAPDLSQLSLATSSNPSGSTLASSLFYNSTTHELTYENIPGQSLASVLNLLENLQVFVTKNGVIQYADQPTDLVPETTTVSVINAATAQALLKQYNTLGAIPATAPGYLIGGGGSFDIAAHNLDLGTTPGIVSKGAGLYKVGSSYPLAALFGNGGVFDRGADINVNLTGDLTMYSSTISSLQGGNITVNAGGDVNVGSSDFSVNTLAARGIFTTADSDVSVYAGGDINVSGSRIATYDGGDITVESTGGDVSAGNGASGFVILNAFYVDPVTHQVYTDAPTIPGSGIQATTFLPRDPSYPAPPNTVGNILVVTPNGGIDASAGGIAQTPFNGSAFSQATITLIAGKQPILDTTGGSQGAVTLYVYDKAAQTWKLETGRLQVVNGPNGPQVEDEAVLDSQNLVTLGTAISVTIGKVTDALVPVMSSTGTPLTDALGNEIYVSNLSSSGGTLVTMQSSNGKTTLPTYLDANGLPITVVALKDANGNLLVSPTGGPVYALGRPIIASGSGVIGSKIFVDATGIIDGLFFGTDVSISSLDPVVVTVLASGRADVSGLSVSGQIIGLSGVDVSGDQVTADLLSNEGIVGATSGQSGLAPGTAANAAATGVSNAGATPAVAKQTATTEVDDGKNKKGKTIGLAQKVSRVTVLLPQKSGT